MRLSVGFSKTSNSSTLVMNTIYLVLIKYPTVEADRHNFKPISGVNKMDTTRTSPLFFFVCFQWFTPQQETLRCAAADTSWRISVNNTSVRYTAAQNIQSLVKQMSEDAFKISIQLLNMLEKDKKKCCKISAIDLMCCDQSSRGCFTHSDPNRKRRNHYIL